MPILLPIASFISKTVPVTGWHSGNVYWMNNQSPTAYRIHFGVLSLIYQILHSLPTGDHSFPCSFIFFFQYLFYLFTWLYQVLVAPWGIFFFFFSQLQHVGSSFLTRDWTQAPALGVWSLSYWTTREVPLACDHWEICSSCPSGPILILLHYLECPALLHLAPDHLLLTKSQLRYYLPQKVFPDTHTHTSLRMNEAPLTENPSHTCLLFHSCKVPWWSVESVYNSIP